MLLLFHPSLTPLGSNRLLSVSIALSACLLLYFYLLFLLFDGFSVFVTVLLILLSFAGTPVLSCDSWFMVPWVLFRCNILFPFLPIITFSSSLYCFSLQLLFWC